MAKQIEVYQCSKCGRKTKVPRNKIGLSVLYNCTITSNCLGKLNKITNIIDIINTPDITPEIPGVQDWYQRQVLFTYHQSTPATNWIIKHNLNNNPTYNVMVDTGDGILTQAYPIITVIDYNTTILTFDEKSYGIAQATALSSQNTYITPVTTVAPVLQPLSIPSGVVTIATRDLSNILQLNTTWQVSSISQINLQYANIHVNPKHNSPWSNINKLFINGVFYNTRTINFLNDSNNGANFTNGSIPNGCSLTITNSNDTDVLILLSSSPYTINDKIYDKVVNINSATDISHSLITYSNGVLYADPSIVKSIFPYIKVV